jgi:prepilin-type N-terminal cleavage/methylation domain-containing protein
MPVKIKIVAMLHRHSARGANRGFTLIELMAVVVITGILAVAGVSLFRQQLVASKGTEAVTVIQAIRAAEEAYAAENHIYKNVSVASGGIAWYPSGAAKTRSAWVQEAHVDYLNWRALAPSVNRSVLFGYLVHAGEAGSTVPELQLKPSPAFPVPMTLGWYTIEARGDTDGDGAFAMYAASSMNAELLIENEGE